MKGIAPQDRPREKMARAGAAALGDNELVAVLIGSGTRAKNAMTVAGEVLEVAGGTTGLLRLELDELTAIDGMGLSRAARLLAAVELGRRVVAGPVPERPRLRSTRQLAAYLLALYGGHRVERFGLVLLDARCHVIRTTILTEGLVDSSLIHPREVFREAAIACATSLVLFHNHPSGDPEPSRDDTLLTRRMVCAGELMGIEVTDHIILGESGYFSYKERAGL